MTFGSKLQPLALRLCGGEFGFEGAGEVSQNNYAGVAPLNIRSGANAFPLIVFFFDQQLESVPAVPSAIR